MKAAVERRMEILDMVNQRGQNQSRRSHAELFKVSQVSLSAAI